MQGQFIYATSRAAGLRVNSIIRNTTRVLDSVSEKSDLYVSLLAFQNGEEIYSKQNYGVIKHGDFLEINETDLPLSAAMESECLIVVICTRGDEGGYFSQEHQLNYESIENPSRRASVVYDQLPVISGALAKPRPILLLASKIWTSSKLNTYISFTNFTPNQSSKNTTWNISLLDCSGTLIREFLLSNPENSAMILSVKDILGEGVLFLDDIKMYTLVARGDAVSSVLLTFLKDETSESFAVEHSLSPHYYINGDFSRVRKEAFIFQKDVLF